MRYTFRFNGVTYNNAKINGQYLYTYSDEMLTFYYALGDNILDDYNSITASKLGDEYTLFNDLNVAPPEANYIVGVNSSNKIKSRTPIPSTFKANTGQKMYTVGLLSDIHIDGNGDGNDSDSGNSQADFINSLQYFNDKQVDFISICGDITYYGYTADYNAYMNIIKNYSNGIPVKSLRGNHECYVNGESNYNSSNTQFQDITGQELYYEYTIQNDVYLFVGIHKESSDCFSTTEMNWLSQKLEEHKNKRVFLFQHYNYGQVGNYNNIGKQNEITNATFINLIKTYKDVICFSGHTHLDFDIQRFYDKANIAYKDDVCHRVHIPSGTKPRISSTGESGSSSNYYEGSKGYIMEVYENGLLFKGVDFRTNTFIPYAIYFLSLSIPRTRVGLYSWEYEDFTELNRLASACDVLGVTEVYQQMPDMSTLSVDEINRLSDDIYSFKELTNYNVDVIYLTGDSSWYNNPDLVIDMLNGIVNFNANNYNNVEINKVLLDIEPWILGLDVEEWWSTYEDTMKTIYSHCKTNQLELILCVPFWLDSTINPSIFDTIYDFCDGCQVMNYNRNIFLTSMDTEVESAKMKNKYVYTVAECQPPNEEYGVTETLTYYNVGLNALTDDWNSLRTNFV